MSGIIPPSIVTYDLPVDLSSFRYISVSFPFRVKIEKIWFTGDQTLFNGVGDFYGDRELKLAAFKVKNTKTQHDPVDAPSDGTNFFGTLTEKPYIMQPDETLKPTMWLGNPDSRPAGQVVQVAGLGGGYVFRSTTKSAPEIDDPANVGWTNGGWSEEEFNLYSYKTDLSIMNTDEMLGMFVYNSAGDWGDYVNGSAYVTIHVAYSGAAFQDAQSAPVSPWTPWIED